MLLYEGLVLLLTFLLLNVPVFISLHKYLLRDLNTFTKLAFGILYWSLAFFTHELAPFLGVLILLYKVHGKQEQDIYARENDIWRLSFRDAASVVFTSLIFKLVINQINKLYVNVLDMYFSMDPKPQAIVEEFALGELYYKILLFALVVVLAPFVEEYIFRYYIYDKLLLPRMPAAAAAIIAAALFTLLHMNVSGIPTFFGLGLFCTFVYEKKGYYGAVIAHIVSNLFTAVFLM